MDHDIDFYIPKEKYFGETIKPYSSQNSSKNSIVVINGFPYDEGTRRNGGRVGGAVASQIFRKTLLERELYASSNTLVMDSGDIEAELTLQDAHENLFIKQKKLLTQNQNGVIFSIGGSNDQSFPNARALIETYPNAKIGVINIDAHFDVRPLKQGQAHSGSPFRQMLEHQIFKSNGSLFIQFACKGAVCSNEHFKYLQSKNVPVYWLQKNIRMHQISQNSQWTTQAGQLFSQILQKLSESVDKIFISFDTDSINSKYMPGVSAPSVVGGLTSSEAIQIMKISGKNSKVKLLDFSQFNPAVESLISSRMLTQMFYTFATTFSQRSNL